MSEIRLHSGFLALQFGRVVFAEPANRIALRELGEGLKLSRNRLSLTYIVRRESETGAFSDKSDNDHGTWIAQAQNLPIYGSFFQSMNLVGLRGEDRKDGKSYDYNTYGGDIFFGLPPNLNLDRGTSLYSISGSFSLYSSKRTAKAGSEIRDGEGEVGLLTITGALGKEKDGRTTVARSLTGYFGQGSGDRSSTEADEAYIGENAGFALDNLFLSSIAGMVNTNGEGIVGRGLVNKRYVGLQYTDNERSPLAWIAESVFRVPEDDVTSKSWSLKAHDYRFIESVMGSRNAGWEVDLEFQVESPKGVKATVQGSYFKPGDSLRDLFHTRVWSVVGRISIEPQFR